MKNSKKWLLTAVLIVTALVVAGQRSFADSMATLYNPTEMNQVFAGLSGGSFSGNIADYQRNLPGTFSANGTQIYYLSANPGESAGAGYFFKSYLTINLNGSETSVKDFDFFGEYLGVKPSYNSDYTQRLVYTGSGSGNLSFKMSITDYWFAANYFSNDYMSQNNWGSVIEPDYGVNHFIYYDVTSLLSGLASGSTAYLVGYEDISMMNDRNTPNGNFQMDYTDALFLVITSSGGQDSSTPEPATMFLWTLGGLSMAGASWRRNRNKKKLLA